MENRVVALSVLEDLIHWPLAPRDGSTAPNYSNFYLTGKLSDGKDPQLEDGDDEDELCFVAANAVGDQHLEPRLRRQARYRAVLRLPLLCHKLGARWVHSEVVPYLLRCLEEEDAQLSFVVGVALLGLLLPTSLGGGVSNGKPVGSASDKESKRGGKGGAEDGTAGPSTAYHSYLALEAVQPVLEALAASRDASTRHFAAQVVIPHALFGISLETSVNFSVGGWEAAYIPQRVHAEVVAQRGADAGMGGSGNSDGGGSSSAASEQGGFDLGPNGEEEDGGYLTRLLTSAYQQRQRKRQGIADKKRGKSEAGRTFPRGEESAAVAVGMADPLQLKGDMGFLADEEFTSLCLAQRRDPVLAPCGMREAGAASAAASATTERRTKLALLSRVRACGGLTLLRGVPLALYGATYAAERANAMAGPPDYFFLSVHAHALIDDIAAWMQALAPSRQSSSSRGRQEQTRGNTSGASHKAPPVARERALHLSDYLSDDAPSPPPDDGKSDKSVPPAAFLSRRAALQQRWSVGLKMIKGLLSATQPGTVAAAVETISLLQNAISCVLSGADVSALALALSPAAAPVQQRHHLHQKGSFKGLTVVAKPVTPLKTEAELQAFQYYCTRRHVAFCLIAATTQQPADSMSSLECLSTLTDLQGELNKLLMEAGILVPMPMGSDSDAATKGSTRTASAAVTPQLSLQLGPGPKEVRGGPLSCWDVCFSSHGVAAAIGEGFTAGSSSGDGPMDVAHLLVSSASASASASAKGSGGGGGAVPLVTNSGFTTRGAVLYATENMSSIFRQHRMIRIAVLTSLPLALDSAGLLGPVVPSSVASARRSGKKKEEWSLSLSTVCRLLLEVIAPPSTLPALLKDMTTGEAGTTGQREADEAAAAALPPSPTVRISSFTPAGEEETPASLDFGVVEAALSAVHRLLAEVAVALPALIGRAYAPPSSTTTTNSPPSHMTMAAWRAADEGLRQHAERVLLKLFTVVQVCLRVVSVYPSWKARWLLARKATGIVSAYLYAVLRVGQSGQAAADHANWLRAQASSAGAAPAAATWYVSSLPTMLSQWYYRTSKLLTALLSVSGNNSNNSNSSSSTGNTHQRKCAAPQPQQNFFAQWIADEEAEVRCVAVPAAALLFDVMAQAATEVAACEAKHRGSAKPPDAKQEESNETFHLSFLGYTDRYGPDLVSALGPLLQPLVPLVEGVIVGCESALLDRQPSVRCAAASALSAVSRTLSALCSVAAVAAAAATTTPKSVPVGKGTAQHHQHQQQLLPASVGGTVWRAYLTKATDALLSLMSDKSSAVQLTLVAELADLLVTAPAPLPSPDGGGEGGVASDGSTAPSAGQVRHAALLSCLESLSTHEVWRFRERYAVLLCEMTTKFLTPRFARVAVADPIAAGGGHGSSEPRASAGAIEDGAAGAGSAGWAHTHPLFRLARQELLPMLVAVLFDKVKAVRDAALDAAEAMCGRLNAAAAAATGGRPLGGAENGAEGSQGDGTASGWSGGTNRFVNDVLWPLIRDSPKAWETYLSRSALLRVAVRLRVDKESTLLPLLDQLAHDAVLNVRLVVAKTIHEILVQSGAGGGGNNHSGSRRNPFSPTMNSMGTSSTQLFGALPRSSSAKSLTSASSTSMLSSMVKRGKGGVDSGGGLPDAPALPPIVFTDEEKDGVVLQLLRQLLEDASADVRDEAARALKVCF